MKTPEEIKEGLRHCALVQDDEPCGFTCPYRTMRYRCLKQLPMDARAYIQQLEERIAKRDELLAVMGVKVPEGNDHEKPV